MSSKFQILILLFATLAIKIGDAEGDNDCEPLRVLSGYDLDSNLKYYEIPESEVASRPWVEEQSGFFYRFRDRATGNCVVNLDRPCSLDDGCPHGSHCYKGRVGDEDEDTQWMGKCSCNYTWKPLEDATGCRPGPKYGQICDEETSPCSYDDNLFCLDKICGCADEDTWAHNRVDNKCYRRLLTACDYDQKNYCAPNAQCTEFGNGRYCKCAPGFVASHGTCYPTHNNGHY